MRRTGVYTMPSGNSGRGSSGVVRASSAAALSCSSSDASSRFFSAANCSCIHSGIVKWKVVSPGREVKPIVPPCRSTIAFEMLRPRPVPPFCRVDEASAWANFSNTRSLNSAGTPGP